MAYEVGYAGKVMVATDSGGTAGSFVAVGGQAEANITPKNNSADVTGTNQAGFDQKIPTTQAADLSLKLFYIAGGADPGQVILLNSLQNRTFIWLKVYRDATAFSEAYCFVTEFPTKITGKDPVAVEVKLEFCGLPSVSPASPLTVA